MNIVAKINSFLPKSLLTIALSMMMTAEVVNGQNRQKFVVDEVVAVVGSSMILLSELNSNEQYLKMEYQRQGYSSPNLRAEALESLLMQKLLATQAAIDSLPINENVINNMTTQRIEQLIEMRGSKKALEDHYQKPIYAISDIVRKKMRENELAQSMQRKLQSEGAVTPAEVKEFYKQIDKDSLPIIPEQYIYAKIAKLPLKNDDRKLDVKEELLALRERIVGGASFSALARMYSDDIGSAKRGGEMDPQPSNVFVPEFKDAVESLKVGEISGVIETEFGYHILEVMEKKGSLYRVRHILLKVKFNSEDRVRAIEQMDSVYKQLIDKTISFEDAVAKYSDDTKSKMNQGKAINDLYQSYGAKYKSFLFKREELDLLYDYIKGLEKDEISQPFVFVDKARDESVMIVKLLDIIPSHTANIKDDYSAIEEIALNIKRNKDYNKWINDKIDEMYIRIEKPYQNLNFSNHKWIK